MKIMNLEKTYKKQKQYINYENRTRLNWYNPHTI